VTTSEIERRTAPPATADSEQPAQKVEIVVSVPTVVKALAILLGVVLVVVAQDAILSILLSAVMVLGLDPPVSALERRGWGRGKAALAVFAAIATILFVIVVWAVVPVWNEITQLVAKLPSYVEELRESAVFKQLDENTEALEKLQSTLADAAKQIPESAVQLLGAAGSAIGQVFSLVTLVFLTLFGLIAKPTLTHAALDLMRPQTAARVGATLDEVTNTISFSLVGNVVISVIAGTVVGVAAVIVDAPFPVVLALIVGLFDLIPQIGSAIAAIIVVTITLIATGPAAAVILLAVILVYQQVENYLIQPAVMRQAVELSGFATIACVMLGGALLGVVGAILAVPVAASVKVIVREATEGRRARMAALGGDGGKPGVDGAEALVATRG
jgi:predicted PurR-regulated permease PerM